MINKLQHGYCFDDILLIPEKSVLNHRSEANLGTTIAGLYLDMPIIAANMSTICETKMAKAMYNLGGLGIIHRMCSIEEQYKMLCDVYNGKRVVWPLPDNQPLVGFSIGIGNDWRERIVACKDWANVVCLDVAHAHSKRVLKVLADYFKEFKDYPIIIGQVSTVDSVRDILNVIPEQYHNTIAFKTSIGGGSLCTTRLKTGFGVPTFQSVLDIRQYLKSINKDYISVIADGGIKNSGDIVKSFVAGANAVMLGSLLSGTDETPGDVIYEWEQYQLKSFKHYRGSASFNDKVKRNESPSNIEGESTLVPCKGPVKDVVNALLDGVRSGMSYGGAKFIKDLQEVKFNVVTQSGYKEGTPHLI